MTQATNILDRPTVAPPLPSDVSPRPARWAATGAGGFLAAVVLLHALKPELEPSWRMVSEYSIGRHGWTMRLAFLALATGCVSLERALRGHIRGPAARVGRVALLVSGLGTAIAGVFATDPITAARSEMTTQGSLHGLGFMLGVPGLILAVSLLTRCLRKTTPRAGAVRGARALMWLSVVAYAATMATTYEGAFGPDVPVGWSNRLLVAAFALWILAAAGLVGQSSQPH